MNTAWLDKLPSRLRKLLLMYHKHDMLPSLDLEYIRSISETGWRREPGIGVRSVKAIREAVSDEYVSIEEQINRSKTPWIEAMPVRRARSMLYYAFIQGELPDLERSSVRAKGAEYWRRQYWVGKKTFAAIAYAVGGFDK